MGFNIAELLGFYALVIGVALIIGAAFLCSVIAGMFTAGGVFVLIGGTVVYIANARAAQKALEASASTPMRSAA